MKRIHEYYYFCAGVQICAVIVAIASTTKLSLFVHHLAGFTLLLQSAVAVSIVIRIGGRRCLDLAKCKVSHTVIWGIAGLTGLGAYTAILIAYGRYLPGIAKELPPPTQLAVAIMAVAISLYVARLHRNNQQLFHSGREARQQSLIKHLRHHFLFNALNTTVCLIKSQPEVAICILTDLSQLFRTMLQQKPITTINEETTFVRRYIYIERTRLGPRLGVEWRLPDCKHGNIKMPSMIVQPLVENAIYHGVETCEEGGIIQITIEVRGNRVFCNICNPVGDTVPVNHRQGNRTAQKSVRDRLLQTYGSACRYTHKQRRGKYCVAFSIPREDP